MGFLSMGPGQTTPASSPRVERFLAVLNSSVVRNSSKRSRTSLNCAGAALVRALRPHVQANGCADQAVPSRTMVLQSDLAVPSA